MTSTNSKPVVFVSSVIYTLERERSDISRLIASFGFDCQMSGINDTQFWGDPISACRRGVDKCDLYVGVFCIRSGSIIFADHIFVTEMEFYEALNSRRPMLIYILGRPNLSPDVDLQHFLKSIKVERYVKTCRSRRELLNRLAKDLEDFSEEFNGKTARSLVPPRRLDQALRQANVFSTEASLYGLHLSRESFRPDREFILQRMSEMKVYYERHEFASAAAVGVRLMQAFMRLRVSYRQKDLARLWAEFLKMWAGSCTWLGYVAGSFGAINASLMRKEAYRTLQEWSSFNESDELIANCYYVLADRNKAMRVSYRETNQPDPVDTATLRQALVHDERYARKTQAPFPHLHRAYVYLALGDYDLAIADFTRMLKYGSALRELAYHDYLVSYGQASTLKGLAEERRLLIREGGSVLKEAYRGIQQFADSPFYLPFMKRIAKSYINVGETDEAEALLQGLYPLALRKRLNHQAEGIIALITTVDDQRWRNRNTIKRSN